MFEAVGVAVGGVPLVPTELVAEAALVDPAAAVPAAAAALLRAAA